MRIDVLIPQVQDRVRVELRPFNNPVEQRHELRAKTDWARVQDIPAWQLRQYRSRRDDGAWGYVSYDALREVDVTPMGHRIEFVCQGVPNGEPVQCQGAYRLDAQTQVWYFFHHRWMAQWAQIHAQVVKAVDQHQQTGHPNRGMRLGVNMNMHINPHFRPVDLAHASRLINHGPTVLVTSLHGGRRNVMAAAWSMPVEFVPPRISVVIDKKTFTSELVQASGHLGLCIPGAGVARLVHAVGSESGRDPGTHGNDLVDKFARHGIDARPGPVLGVPVLEDGMVAWLECRLIPEPHTEEAYDTCFAEVVAAAADERVFSNGRWHFSDQHPDLHTLHYLGGGQFVRSGAVISL